MVTKLTRCEIIALNRIKLGGINALRTETYHTDCKTVGSLMRKGLLGRDNLTNAGRAIVANFDHETPTH